MKRRFNWAVLVVIPLLALLWMVAIGGGMVLLATIRGFLRGY